VSQARIIGADPLRLGGESAPRRTSRAKHLKGLELEKTRQTKLLADALFGNEVTKEASRKW
jgi:hypothetical protein